MKIQSVVFTARRYA